MIMERMASKHTDTSELHNGMTQKEVQRYSLGRALVAACTGDWTQAGIELECSKAVASIMGRAPEGFFVPFEVMNRDFNVGTASEAGNFVPTNLRPDMYVDVLRNAMSMGKLGVTYLAGLSGNVDLPRKSTAGTLAMVTEIGAVAGEGRVGSGLRWRGPSGSRCALGRAAAGPGACGPWPAAPAALSPNVWTQLA
jgi:hypothetical protein